MAGLGSKESLMNSILIGVTNLIFTLAGMRLIDVLGRKQLMIIGSIGYILSLGMVAFSFSIILTGSLNGIYSCIYCLSRYWARSSNLVLFGNIPE
jgi:hypothetical protein